MDSKEAIMKFAEDTTWIPGSKRLKDAKHTDFPGNTPQGTLRWFIRKLYEAGYEIRKK